jgi:hypothetical protein
VFEDRVLRRIFGPKRDEAMGGWIKLHNEELCDLYCSPSIIRMIKSRKLRRTGNVVQMRIRRTHAYMLFVGKPEGKRPLGRPSHRWVHNIKMDLKEIGWNGMDWIGVARDREQWRALSDSIKCWEVFEWLNN